MLGMILITIIMVLAYLKLSKGKLGEFKQDVVKEVMDELFDEKDLPIKDTIKLAKGFDIKLYGLKYKDEENGVLDNDNLTYARLLNIINKHTKVDTVDSDDGVGFQLDIYLDDFKKEEHSTLYMELVSYTTNFNLAQFIFKGEDKFAMFNIDAEYINKMKEHTDEIINEMFMEVFRLMKENDNEGLFDKIGTTI